ncbi:YczI family protein [Solibacillus sp. FSL W7-1436]|uniref:YczI family protein n=1 Tax=Solibacillus sp. FSL W7-1436 TaxID=2921705 RepID=UPI0030F4CA3D
MKEMKVDILVVFQLTLGLLAALIGIYSLVTDRFHLQPFMFIVMSAMFGVIGFREYRRTQNKQSGILYWVVSVLIFGVVFVSLFG